MVTKKPKGLGRGLDALLGADTNSLDQVGQPPTLTNAPNTLLITQLQAGKYQPRTRMDEGALAELADSIRAQGIMQPILVRPLDALKGQYEIIAGERRFRAAQLAGLTEVPVLVKNVADEHAAAMALIENIQREDLNAIEVAISYQRLIEECKLTQEQLSEKIAKSRSNIANYLRLLKLPVEIQAGVRDSLISMGHARALVTIPDEAEQIRRFNLIISENLSVRDIENLSKTGVKTVTSTASKSIPKALNSSQEAIKNFLTDRFSTKVSIEKAAKGNGKLVLHFNSESDLNRLIELLKNS